MFSFPSRKLEHLKKFHSLNRPPSLLLFRVVREGGGQDMMERKKINLSLIYYQFCRLHFSNFCKKCVREKILLGCNEADLQKNVRTTFKTSRLRLNTVRLALQNIFSEIYFAVPILHYTLIELTRKQQAQLPY